MEGRLPQGILLKKVFEAIKEMVTDVNFECTDAGIQIQAMDASHVALVIFDLKMGAFDHWTCPQYCQLGINMVAMAKIFKLCGAEDQVIIRFEQNQDSVILVFETPGQDKVSDFELRLMNISTDQLGLPETEYAASITMPSKEFSKVVADLGQFSDTSNTFHNSLNLRSPNRSQSKRRQVQRKRRFRFGKQRFQT